MMYSLDEIGLIPSVITELKHRKEAYPFIQNEFGEEKLPVFVSPMTCIIDSNNIEAFDVSKFDPILPVCADRLDQRAQLPSGESWNKWTALTLKEFKHLFNNCNASDDKRYYILIDVANGHMKELYDSVRDAKQEYGCNLTVMIGNIANPKTYLECCKAGVDYVRIGIGGGSGCTTSVQTGIHTSIPYILEGIKEIKKGKYMVPYETRPVPATFYEWLDYHGGTETKVVADGGINTISKAIKCLALGADYVMMGKCFAECEEATLMPVTSFDKTGNVVKRTRHYYGQSSEQGQLDRFGKVKNSPEGTDTWVEVNTNLADFTTVFAASLRSAMSYCDAYTLDEFIGKVSYDIMSPTEFNSFNK